MKNTIHLACLALEEALIREYEASQMELESKVAKQKTHYDVLKAKDALQEINFY